MTGFGIDFQHSQGIELRSNTRITHVPDGFVICTAQYRTDELAAQFGRFCVEIRQPGRFFELVDGRITRLGLAARGEFDRVRYTQLEYYDDDLPPGEIGFVKRPDGYAAQGEIRLLWKHRVRPPLSAQALLCPGVGRLCRLLE